MLKDLAQRRSIPSLDGLRGIAVLMVILAHLGYVDMVSSTLTRHHFGRFAQLLNIDFGDLGVSVFFVISGYLITTLLMGHQDSDGRVSLKNFYARRFFRIFPPYYFYLFVLAVMWGLHMVPMVRGAFVASALYVSNYYPYHLSHPSTDGWLVGHTWSLSLEEQFYLMWPACLHWLGRKRSAWLGLALLPLSPLARMLTLHLLPGTILFGQVDRMFHSRIDTIMAGCVLALIGVWPRAQRLLVRCIQSPSSGAIALLLLYAILRVNRQNFATLQWFGIGAEATLLAFVLYYFVANADGWGGRLLNNPLLRHLGVISYSLYLWQQLWTGPVKIGGRLHFWQLLLAILACAEVSYFMVEKPSYRVRDWYLARH